MSRSTSVLSVRPTGERRISRALALVAVAALGAVGLAPAASGVGLASISGTVTLPPGVLGVTAADITVTAAPVSSGSWITASVAADGSYTIPELPAGVYTVRFDPPAGSSLAAEYYDGVYGWQDALPVPVTTEPVTGIDAALEVGGTITGTVAVPAGSSVDGSTVSANDWPTGAYGQTQVAADGTYTITGLAPGAGYRISFTPGDAALVPELWTNAYSNNDATPVTVALGAVVPDVDATFELGGSIAGHVSAPAGTDVSSIQVDVSGPVSRNTLAQADGTYRLTGLPAGLYQVRFSSWSTNVLPEYWNDAPTELTATPVSVTAGAERAGINAILTTGGSISGTVTVPAGSDLMPSVNVYDVATNQPVGSSSVAWDGTYHVGGLGTGSYKVGFSTFGTGLIGEYWDDVRSLQAATPVSVVAGQDTPGINAALVEGGVITGHVTVPAGVSPMSVSVWAASANGAPGGASGSVDVDGTYLIQGLDAGSYTVSFSAASAGLVPQYWHGATSWMGATPITVVLGSTTADIDAAMVRGATISGTVSDVDGPRAGIQVLASPTGAGFFGGGASATTAPDGTYTLAGLAAGTYVVSFGGGPGPDLVGEYYDDVRQAADATPVVLAAGDHQGGIDATLGLGAHVSGTITGPGGQPVAGAFVSIEPADPTVGVWYSAETGVDGTYHLQGVADGLYLVGVEPPSGSVLAPSFWGGPTRAQASVLDVLPAENQSGLDVALVVGATVSGTVRSYTGAAVPNAYVVLGSPDFWTDAVTDIDGRYTMVGVPQGGYTVDASAADRELMPQWWQGQVRRVDADLLDVSTAQVRTGIDFDLGHAAKISGTVTVPQGFDAYCVTAEAPGLSGPPSTDCEDAGTPYIVGSLGTGPYLVSAWAYTNSGQSTLNRFYVSADRRSQATPVAATAPATTGGVNIDLTGAVTRGPVLPLTAVTLAPGAPVVGLPVTVNVTVTGARGVPSGVVELWDDDGAFYGDAILAGGKASFQHTFTEAVPSIVRVTYGGDASYSTDSASVTVTPQPAPKAATNVVLTSSANPSVLGTPVTLTATVQSTQGMPVGDVTFSGPGGPLGTATLANGAATLVLDQLPVGTTHLQADYLGGTTFDPSAATLDQVVTAAPVPVVTRVEPPSGSPLGGTVVTLTGTGFTGASQVLFGATPGTNLTVVSPTSVQVTAPAGVEGTVPVVVTTPGGTSEVVAAGRFTYVDYVAQTPTRLLTNPAVTPSVVRCVQVAGQAGVPAAATGVFMNVTTVRPTGAGYVVVYPDTAGNGATPAPLASTVNFEPGADVANSAFVAVPADGKVCYATAGAANVGILLDVAGYTLPGAGVTVQASARLVDTRPATLHGPVVGPVTPGHVYTVPVTGHAGVPAGATAALVNVTVTGATGAGNLRVFAADQPVPDTSVVNFAPGKDKANATIVALSASGELSFYSDTFAGTSVNPVQVIIDVVGYVQAGSTFTGIAPKRLMDSRPGTGHAGPYTGPLTRQTVYALDVAGSVPAGATAVVLNVTAVGPTTGGNLRVYPDTGGTGATPPPLASSINYIAGRDIPNMVVVALPADGKVDLYSDQFSGTVNLVVDVVGYIANPS
ncbi:MAG TPA: carboxypeptidase regulatory-like domain-containing protein [Actinotalea sp.]